MKAEFSGATFELLVKNGRNMDPVVFAVEECGVRWFYSGVCGCCEVHTVNVFIEVDTLLMWDNGAKGVVTTHGVGEGY